MNADKQTGNRTESAGKASAGTPERRVEGEKRLFHGWILVAVAWICYGFGIAPGYYSWGAFSKEMIGEFHLSRTAFNSVWGLYTFLQSAIGPLAGLAIARWGVRNTMVAGSLAAALGFFWLSQSKSLAECYLGFAVLGGAGIGLSTFLPTQTLAQNWFIRRRGLAIGIIMTAGGIVGLAVPLFDAWILERGSWRQGWLIIGFTSAAVALLAAWMIRDTPEQMDLRPDGAHPVGSPQGVSAVTSPAEPEWTAAAAIRTMPFLLVTAGSIAYTVPWAVLAGNGRLHLEQQGYTTAAAAALISFMILVSVPGRLGGALCDRWPAQKVLALALVLEGAGTLLLLPAAEAAVSYAGVTLIGLGFGTAYSSVPAVLSSFFGRRAFATTSGTRHLIGACVLLAASPLAGWTYDRTGSYDAALTGLAAVAFLGSLAALLARAPGRGVSFRVSGCANRAANDSERSGHIVK